MAAGQLAQRLESQALHRLGVAGRFNQQAERGLWQDAAALAAEGNDGCSHGKLLKRRPACR